MHYLTELHSFSQITGVGLQYNGPSFIAGGFSERNPPADKRNSQDSALLIFHIVPPRTLVVISRARP